MLRLNVGLKRVTLAEPVTGPLASRLNATAEEIEWLKGFLSFKVTDWSGGIAVTRTVYLCNADGSFPGGLLPLVEAGGSENGLRVQAIEQRVQPVHPDYRADLAWLRPYQREAVHAVGSNPRCILKLTTGSGKGEIVAAIPRFIPTQWTVLVHRNHLLADLSERFELRTAEQAGRIGGSGKPVQRRVTFATFGTLREHLHDPAYKSLFDCTRGVIVDECHSSAAETHMDVLQRFHNAYWHVGLSGTPLARMDRRSILAVAHLGPIAYEINAQELIGLGSIQEPRIRMVACHHVPDEDGGMLSLTWPDLYKQEIVRHEYRNTLLARALSRSPGPRLMFVNDIAHGDILAEKLHAEGMRVVFAKGDLSLKQRLAVIRDLSEGRLDAAVATVIFNEGVNIPDLRTVGIAAGGKAAIASVQRVGRVTRTAEGKYGCDVWDIDDRGHPTLEAHSRARRRAYLKEGYKVETQDFPVFADAPLAQGRIPGV